MIALSFVRKILDRARQRQSRALAFYGDQNNPPDLRMGLDCVLMWMRKLHLVEADAVIWNFGGLNKRQYKEVKLNSWLNNGRVLPSDACTSFDIGGFVPDTKADLTDYAWYASISSETNSLLFVLDAGMTKVSDELLSEMALNFRMASCFEYGYAFCIPMENGPQAYERGLLFGPSSKRRLSLTEEHEILKWGSAKRGCGDYLDDTIRHYLRDVFPLNFINPHHLGMQVKGQSLKDWIEADPKRGSLKPLIEGQLWTWAVPENRIQAIRKILGPERLLISWGDFNTPSGGPLGHTYGAKKGEGPALFKGQALSKDEERWLAGGIEKIKPIFTRYTAESPAHFDKLLASSEPLFDKLLDLAFTAWSEDRRPDRPDADDVLQAFSAALGERLVKHYRMGWYVLEDEHGRSLGVCHRGPGGSQTWAHPVDSVAKRIDRGETGFVVGLVEAVGEQIKQG